MPAMEAEKTKVLDMNGVRQFTVLLRKNVLLKTRRPCATCFELTLPVVLFLLLAYTRTVYELKTYGPFFFEHGPIGPLSRMLFDEDGFDGSQALVEITRGNAALYNETSSHIIRRRGQGPQEGGNFLTDIEEGLLCETGTLGTLADVLEPILGLRANADETLASWLLKMDPEDAERAARQAVLDLQAWDSNRVIEEADKARWQYLLSSSARSAQDIAPLIDEELRWLQSSLDSPEGAADVRARVEGLVDDLCAWDMTNFHMSGSWHMSGNQVEWNMSSLNMRWNVSWNLSSMWLISRLREMNTSKLDMGDWETSDWAMLDGDGSQELRWNTTMFSEELKELSKKLESSGFADWIRGTGASEMMAPMNDMIKDMNVTSATGMVEELLKMVKNMPVQVAAEAADTLLWWMSHFLRSRSSTARMLGELPGDAEWEMQVTDGIQPPPLELRTSAAGALYRGLWRFQHEDADAMQESIVQTMEMAQEDAEEMSDEMKDKLESDRAKLIETMDKMSDAMLNASEKMQDNEMLNRVAGTMDNISQTVRSQDVSATSLLEDLHRLLDRFASYTPERIEGEILPEWSRQWRSECPRLLNKTWLGEFVERTQRGCPFYRGVVRELGRANASEFVTRMHDNLMTFDMQNLAKHFEYLNQSVHELNATEIGAAVHRLVKGVTSHANGTNTSNTRHVAVRLAHELRHEWMTMRDIRPCSINVREYSQAERRLADTDTPTPASGDASWIMQELSRRKILIAPYRGEAKKLFELAFVEMTLSFVTPDGSGNIPGWLEPLTRCPLVRAAVAKGVELFVQERLITFDTEQELEAHARADPNGVLAALVFESAAPATGDFPPGELDMEYAIRMHAQLLPPTSKIIRMSEYAMFGATRISRYQYLDLGFAYVQEVLGRATARLQALRDMAGDKGGNVTTEIARNIAAGVRTDLGHITVGVEQFPSPQYRMDGFIRIIQHTLPMFMILGWIYAVSLLVREVVYEKQERLREVMRIMGLRTWVYWSSWITFAMIQMTVLVGIMTFILSVSKVLKHSSPSVVFTFFWLYSLSTVCFSMLISSFFSSAKVAAACAGLAYYVTYMPYSLYNRFEDILSLSGKNAFCLLSSTGLGVGMSMIAKWELIEVGVQWDNFAQPPPVTYSGAAPTDSHSLAHVWLMLVIDSVVYLVLAWYIEKVFPGTFGLPQPWYFPLLPSYWFPRKSSTGSVQTTNADVAVDAEKTDNAKMECWEAPAEGQKVSVQIRQLSKIFANGKQALRGVSLDMHQGAILGLLGHNGAGKTTTMAILTGLYPPTDGDVHVNGTSVRRDSLGVRRQLGVCLQQNALYECITVEEHLRLFACLKSVPWSQMTSEVDGLLRDTGLVPKRHAASKALSGGMKRKLSIGIALAGGSQVVTLDEPTAGVDATSRRDIWQLLAAHKAGRTILLSTHFMDEADILSDRVAIIAEGQLTAIGSSMALKRHFADGYMLTIVAADGADTANLTAAVCGAVPEAQCAGARGREFSYVLPFESRARFAALFSQLQDPKVRAQLGVDTYGLSAASMEEVFLRASSVHEAGLHGRVRNGVAQDEAANVATLMLEEASTIASGNSDNGDAPGSKPSSKSGNSPDGGTSPEVGNSPKIGSPSSSKELQDIIPVPEQAEPGPSSLQCMDGPVAPLEEESDVPKKDSSARKAADVPHEGAKLQTGAKVWRGQFGALLRKRAISVSRDRRAWASQLVLPALFVLIALAVARIMEVQEEEPPLLLNTDMFIGTTNAGATSTSIDQHIIPFLDWQQGARSTQVITAFGTAKGPLDSLHPLDSNSTSMAEYLLANSKSLSSTFGAISVDGPPGSTNITLWFKNQGYHAIPVMVNLWSNARMHLLGYTNAKVKVWSHPLPKTQVLMQEEMSGSNQIMTDLTVAITVILAMGFIPASFVVYLVHEKATSGKHQQLLSGVSPTMYWLTSYCWDLVNFLVPLAICFLIFVSFQVGAYAGENSVGVFLLLLFYGACMTPCMYCVEPLFKVPSTAYVTLICVNIFTGTVSVMSTTMMDLYESEIPSMKPVNTFCKALYPWLLPNYCLGRGMIEIAMNHYLNYAAREFGICIRPGLSGDCEVSPLAWNVSGQFLTSLFLMAPVWCGIRLLIEWGFFARGCRMRARKFLKRTSDVPVDPQVVDQAVLCEAERISQTMMASNGTASDRLICANLEKRFEKAGGCRKNRAGNVFAVRSINLGVPAGECFGLLGVNGAGKTTMMRMITGDTEIGGGNVLVGGWSIQDHRDRARQHLGYCPQFDALPDKLTVRETLALYARIRGVPADQVLTTVDTMVSRMCLEAHQGNTCEHLSGGNKRKLSTALALIGEPDVILLDEPSTGVDVGARRFLWDLIGDVRRRGHAIVLTSHSMEECEVLCTRLTIMVQGQFRCLGSPMQLKAKYGGGYTLMVKAKLRKDPEEALAYGDPCTKIREFIAAKVPAAVLSEESVGLFRYRLGNRGGQGTEEEVPLAEIFRTLEEATAPNGALHGCASDYALSQTSLEEVFLHFSQEADGKVGSSSACAAESCVEDRAACAAEQEDTFQIDTPGQPRPTNETKVFFTSGRHGL